MVSLFNSYPTIFIVKLSDLSNLSLVKIASVFYLCELDAWLNASKVMLLASVIDSFSSSIINFTIASRIFVLDKGESLF